MKKGISKKLFIGVDPGTGSSSPTGLTVVEMPSKQILYCSNVSTKHKPLQHRIKDISDQFEEVLTIISKDPLTNELSICVVIEQFVMRGKGGETLQRLIGSFMGRIPYHFELLHVQNTTVKKVLAKHGHAEKEEVAQGVLEFFNNLPFVQELIRQQEWDMLDSLAIAITGIKANGY